MKPESVRIAGKQTPVVLKSRGPQVSESDITAFEARLGHKLPSHYREFLLCYNGGAPTVGTVKGRDDRRNVAYEHGDAVRTFLKLPTARGKVKDFEKLIAPAEIPWKLPQNILPIADDAGGNYFVLELGLGKGRVRFLNHEAFDEPIEQHRILADDFGDFLDRFRSLEEQKTIDKTESKAEVRALRAGKFPVKLELQCKAIDKEHPRIREWIRTVCLQVFHEKGYFAVHGDDLSRTLLDLAFWVNQTARPAVRKTKSSELTSIIECWLQEKNAAFGLTGYSPGFLLEWWADRLRKGSLEGTSENARFTRKASTELLQMLCAMRSQV
jgi:hypothetical protein